MSFSGNSVTVEAESYEKGRFEETIPAQCDGEDFKIVFNYKFVQEVVKAIEKEEVILQVNQSVTPAVFRPVDSDDYFYLVMPIKLTEVRDYDAAPPEINRDAGETADSRY
jgi:DNA polymerase-3 subunit beta